MKTNTNKIEWSKSGNWNTIEGPMYTAKNISEQYLMTPISKTKLVIVGSYCTLGDNHSGYRKTRVYRLMFNGEVVERGFDLKKIMQKADKFAV